MLEHSDGQMERSPEKRTFWKMTVFPFVSSVKYWARPPRISNILGSSACAVELPSSPAASCVLVGPWEVNVPIQWVPGPNLDVEHDAPARKRVQQA